jgi:hypothetical protein
VQTTGWGASGSLTLFKGDFPDDGEAGSLNKFELKSIGGGGKGGLKMSFGRKDRPAYEVAVTYPPLQVQFSGGISGNKIPLTKIEECGQPLGEVFMDMSLKGTTSAAASDDVQTLGLNAGVAASLDLKAQLFKGAFSWGFPVLGVEAATASGFKITVLGFTLGVMQK